MRYAAAIMAVYDEDGELEVNNSGKEKSKTYTDSLHTSLHSRTNT